MRFPPLIFAQEPLLIQCSESGGTRHGLQFKDGLLSSLPSDNNGFFLPLLATRIQDVELNDSISSAQTPSLPITIEGIVAPVGDRDFFRVTLSKDELLVGFLERIRAPDTFHPVVQIHDSTGAPLEAFPLNWPLVFRASRTGDFFLRIDAGVTQSATYRLTVIRIP